MTMDLLGLPGRLCGFSLLKSALSLSSGFCEFLPGSAEQRLLLGELVQCCDLLRIQLRRNLAGLNSSGSEMIRSDVVQDIAARKQDGKERLPAVVYTTEECKELKEYGVSHNLLSG